MTLLYLVWYCRQIKQTCLTQCVNYQNGSVDKSNRPIIVIVLTIRTALQANQTDLSQTLCQPIEQYCRHIEQTYHIHCANYWKGIVDKLNIPIIVTVLTIITVLQTIKQTYDSQRVNYQKGIVDKSNKPLIDTMLTIRTVLQTDQTDLSQTLC